MSYLLIAQSYSLFITFRLYVGYKGLSSISMDYPSIITDSGGYSITRLAVQVHYFFLVRQVLEGQGLATAGLTYDEYQIVIDMIGH